MGFSVIVSIPSWLWARDGLIPHFCRYADIILLAFADTSDIADTANIWVQIELLALLSQYACCHMGFLMVRIVGNINEFLNQGPRSNGCSRRGCDRRTDKTDGNVGNIYGCYMVLVFSRACSELGRQTPYCPKTKTLSMPCFMSLGKEVALPITNYTLITNVNCQGCHL